MTQEIEINQWFKPFDQKYNENSDKEEYEIYSSIRPLATNGLFPPIPIGIRLGKELDGPQPRQIEGITPFDESGYQITNRDMTIETRIRKLTKIATQNKKISPDSNLLLYCDIDPEDLEPLRLAKLHDEYNETYDLDEQVKLFVASLGFVIDIKGYLFMSQPIMEFPTLIVTLDKFYPGDIGPMPTKEDYPYQKPDISTELFHPGLNLYLPDDFALLEFIRAKFIIAPLYMS